MAAFGLGLPVAAFQLVVSAQGEAAVPLRLAWDKSFGRDGVSTEFRALSAWNTNEFIVAASERDTLNPTASSTVRLLIWRVDGAGVQTSEVEVRGQGTGELPNTATIRDVVALENREILALVDFVGGRPSIVRLDRSGRQTTREVFGAGRTVTLFRIVPGARGRFLLVGHESLDALAVAVDGEGNVIWERKQDRGRMDMFVDAAATQDGGFLVVGNSGTYDALRAGESTVFMTLLNDKGEPQPEVTFPGRYGRVAHAANGGFAIVYDQSATNDQDVHVKGLDPRLREQWNTALLRTTATFSDFQISARPGGGFVLVGGKGGRPALFLVDAQGKRTGSFEGTASERMLDLGAYGLVDGGNGAWVLASSKIDASEQANVRRRVRIRKALME